MLHALFVASALSALLFLVGCATPTPTPDPEPTAICARPNPHRNRNASTDSHCHTDLDTNCNTSTHSYPTLPGILGCEIRMGRRQPNVHGISVSDPYAHS